MRCVVGLPVVVLFVTFARGTLAQPGSVGKPESLVLSRVTLENPSPAGGQFSERRAAPAAKEDRLIIEDAKHAVRIASIVVEGAVDRLLLPSPRAEFGVKTAFKGSADSEQLTVDLRKASLGLWPKENQQVILCLNKLASGDYELASFHASILPPTGSTRKAIETWLVGRTPKPAKPESNSYAKQAAASETILVGVLENVQPAGAGRSTTVGAFRIEESVLGYAGYREAIMVHFPAVGERPRPAEAVRYLLFLKGSRKGDGFVVIDRVRLTDALTELQVRKQSLAALGSRNGVLTTIQATLSEWQDSWNTRDMDRCIRCYSRENRLRKRYHAGREARKELVDQFTSFSGKIRLSIEHIGTGPVAAGECDATRGAQPSEKADVRVSIMLSSGDLVDRRNATMKFVREDGEWLILEEGF